MGSVSQLGSTRARLAPVTRGSALTVSGVLGVLAAVGLWSARPPGLDSESQLALVVFGTGFVVAGWLIGDEQPADRLSALLLAAGLGLLAAGAGGWVLDARTIQGIALAAISLPLAAAIILFPDGHVPGIAGWIALGCCAACAVACVAVPPGDGGTDGGTSATALMFLVVAVLCSAWWRFEHADDPQRRAMLWLGLGLGITVLGGGTLIFAASNSRWITLAMALGLSLPAGMVIGRLAPDIVEIRRVISEAVLYALVGMLVMAVFVIVAEAGELIGGEPLPIGVLALIAVGAGLLVHPARLALQGTVRPLLFGDRPDPISAASHVGDRLSDDPLVAMRALREALALPYAQLLDQTGPIAASGSASTPTQAVPLLIGDAQVGTLVLGLRPGEVRLSAADASVLGIVTPALAQVVRSRALAAQLHDSRGRLIAAVEDERRRLRRDLHDELGPTLTGVGYAADAASNLVSSDPDGARRLLIGLRADTATAITDIRRLVHGLRPPALDDLGLARAVTQRAASMHTASGAALRVSADMPDPLPPLPAAVEVAAYRIVMEALTNVARHAGCDRAWVSIGVHDDALEITVRDEGNAAGRWQPGVGMRSMRERADALGGSVTITSDQAGTRVHARLPLIDRSA